MRVRRRENGSQPGSYADLIVLMIAAFGPYVVSGMVRVDHLVVYTLFAIRLATISVGAHSVLRIRPVGDLRWLLLSIFVLTAGITILLRNYQSPRQLLGAIENHVQPIAILTIVGTAIAGSRDHDLRSLAIRLINLYTFILIANTAISLSVLGATLTGVEEYVVRLLRPFWGDGGAGGVSVAERSLAGFRFSGIFDQPFDAGLHHSFGLLLAVFVIRLEGRLPETRDYVRMLVVAAGGLLSLSKVIIFGGLPIFVAYLLWERWLGRMLWNKVVIIAGVLLAATSGVILSWWIDLLGSLWTSTNLIRIVIGSRFSGADSVVASLTSEVLQSSPVLGLGYGAFTTYDNAYLEYWAQGGVFALLLYLMVLATLARASILQRSSPAGRFYAVVTVLVVFAGIGAPVLTANRFTVVFWMLMTILLTRDAIQCRSQYAARDRTPTREVPDHG